MTTQTTAHPAPGHDSDFDLDVSVVEAGDAVNAFLCSTDNGCNTVAGSDC